MKLLSSFYQFRRLGSLVSLSLALIYFAIPDTAQALTVSPLVIEMNTVGPQRRAQLTIQNEAATGMPVEIMVSRMDLNEAGKVSLAPAGDQFTIFPPQVMIPSGGQQVFRIEWVGEPDIKKSESFMFSVNQLPVAFQKQETGVQLVLNITTIVNVAPKIANANIQLKEIHILKKENNSQRVMVVVYNPTQTHARFSDSQIEITGRAWSRTLKPEELREAIGLGLVLPGKRRRFVLPVDVPKTVKQVGVRITYLGGKDK